MIFLQPFMLWGVPLILAPLLIHLLNRLRYRTVRWGAMQFLLTATRQSTRHARLREWLLLVCRMLAIACVVLALSRPQLGGWLGRQFGGAPETVLLLVDRSASMGTVDATTREAMLSQALERVAGALAVADIRHVLMVDSVHRGTVPVDHPERLAGDSSLAATETAADLPAMLKEALRYLSDHPGERVEIWVITDLQHHAWRPDEARWAPIRQALQEQTPEVRLRVLAIDTHSPENRSVVVETVTTRHLRDQRQLALTFTVTGPAEPSGAIPLRLVLDGNESLLELDMTGNRTRQRINRNLGKRSGSGWGALHVPTDANAHGNAAYFVYGEQVAMKTRVVTATPSAGELLRLAAAPVAEEGQDQARVVSPEQTLRGDWQDLSLILWHGRMPPGDQQEDLRAFMDQGGQVLCFPGDPEGGDTFLGLAWGAELEVGTFEVGTWARTGGVLADTEAGDPLPLDQLAVRQRRSLAGSGEVIAVFADGQPLLMRQSVGLGALYVCATSPLPAWSSLADGPVLVPLVQRLAQTGSERFARVNRAEVGGGEWPQPGRPMQQVYPPDSRTPSLHGGIWRVEDELISLNVPAGELDRRYLSAEEARRLLDPFPLQIWEEAGRTDQALQMDLSSLFWLLVMAALAVETWLTLPILARREPT